MFDSPASPLEKNMAFTLSAAYMYDQSFQILTTEPGQRPLSDLLRLEHSFRRKSNYFLNIPRQTLLDVIQHCDFVTRNKDDVIILQGERGHRFFIILRGSVSVMLKDNVDDVVLGEEKLEARHMNRETLGSVVVTLGEGQTFGELALIHPDCVRTASIVADERTDLVVIHRDLYNRSVSKVIAREYAEKIGFIESLPFLEGWTQRMKRQLAVSLRRENHNFDSTLVKQGDLVREIYFIVHGEVKLVVDPEAHFTEFKRFMDKCRGLIEEDDAAVKSERAYFPQKLLPQLQKYSRMNRASMMKRVSHETGSDSPNVGLPTTWSPSAIRKMNFAMHAQRANVNLCYLGERQIIGDSEMLLNLMFHHATVVCSRETTVMALHRNHFERLFRKKAVSQNLRELTRLVETQLTMRCLKPIIHDNVPLLRCMLYKIQEMNGERRLGDEKRFMARLRALIDEAQSAQSNGRVKSAVAQTGLTPAHERRLQLLASIEAAKQRIIVIPKVV